MGVVVSVSECAWVSVNLHHKPDVRVWLVLWLWVTVIVMVVWMYVRAHSMWMTGRVYECVSVWACLSNCVGECVGMHVRVNVSECVTMCLVLKEGCVSATPGSRTGSGSGEGRWALQVGRRSSKAGTCGSSSFWTTHLSLEESAKDEGTWVDSGKPGGAGVVPVMLASNCVNLVKT